MPRHHADEPVTVLETGDPALLAVAKSLLEAAHIRFYAKGEGLQNLFAGGTLGGFNPVTGPVEIQVASSDAADANAALVELKRRTRG
jgi:hypothetical protein